MDSGIPALIIGAIMLIGAAFMSRSSVQSYDQLGQRLKEVEARAGDQARTRLTVTSTSLDGSRSVLTLQVRNDGQTKLASWRAMDVVVTYSAAAVRQSIWCSHTDGALAANTWTIASISPDAFEPGILNPGETATVSVQVATPVDVASNNVVVIGTEMGITVSAPFAG